MVEIAEQLGDTLLSVSVTTKVPVPALPHVTVTALVLAPLVIVPPVIAHEYECPVTKGVLYELPVLFAQALLLTVGETALIEGVGFGFNVTLYVEEVLEHDGVPPVLSTRVRVPVVPVPHVTVTEFVPDPLVIVPPVIVQAYVWPATNAELYVFPLLPAQDEFAVVLPDAEIEGVGAAIRLTE